MQSQDLGCQMLCAQSESLRFTVGDLCIHQAMHNVNSLRAEFSGKYVSQGAQSELPDRQIQIPVPCDDARCAAQQHNRARAPRVNQSSSGFSSHNEGA